jgi:hypothetical protein
MVDRQSSRCAHPQLRGREQSGEMIILIGAAAAQRYAGPAFIG